MRQSPCEKCGKPANGKLCRTCHFASVRRAPKSCRCGKLLGRMNTSGLCYPCSVKHRHGRLLTVLEEEAARAPNVEQRRKLTGSWAVATDTHIPFHSPKGMHHLCALADRLNVRNLIIGGDVIHADTISKYLGVGRTVSVSEELLAAGRVMAALQEVFTGRIILMPGNHDQRVEKLIASMQETKEGRRALDVVAGLLGVTQTDNSEVLAQAYLGRFFNDPRIEWLPLPDLILNDTWLIQHPGTVSRIPPQTERAMAAKHRKSVIQGHSHLWGLGFDASAEDVTFNCGHLASTEKWRYVREKPGTFPKPVPGYGIILATKEHPAGRLLPVALHPRMVDPLELLGMVSNP